MFTELSFRQNLLLFFVVMVAISLFGIWRSRKESEPIRIAYTKFKYLTIGYAILFYGLLLNLPATFVATLTRPEAFGSLELLRDKYLDLASDVHQMREILQYTLFLILFWIISLIGVLRAVATESNKKTD
jgi:hypothetical protein